MTGPSVSRSLTPPVTLEVVGVRHVLTLRLIPDEVYLWPFANAVRANCATFMCAYQRINGSYACQNSKIMNGLLKEELGFQGAVMSDWYATHSGVASVEAGLDFEMPGHFGFGDMLAGTGEKPFAAFFGGNLTTAVTNGTLPIERLDDMVIRIMTPFFALKQDEDFPSVDPSVARLGFFPRQTWLRSEEELGMTGPAHRDVREDHGQLIRRHAAESTVLLKNEGALPLKAPKRIAIYGNDAGPVTEGPLNQNQFEFGSLAVGGGSGAGQYSYMVDPLQAIKTRAAQDDTLVEHWLNNSLVLSSHDLYLGNFVPTPAPNDPEVCIVFLKSWATEMFDRFTLSLDWQGNELAERVASFCSNTIVVTHSSGVNVLPFADHPNVTAILAAHYPGMETGNSIVDVLYGDVNPSGHLPYTIAYNASDYNGNITTDILTDGEDDWQSWFTERLEIDYRYFDAHDIDVRYEFGYGLSYTTFNMTGFYVGPKDDDAPVRVTARPPPLETVPGGNPALWETLYVTEVTVSNTGDVDGSAVPQLYVSFPDSAPEGTPLRQLRGFEKVPLAPGEAKTVSFDLMRRDLSYWNVVEQDWIIPRGEFTLSIGWSSRDLVASATLTAVSSFKCA